MKLSPTLAAEEPETRGWLAPRRSADVVFFDGHCGFCHGSVLFLLAREPEGEPKLRFAPLGGSTFLKRLPPESHECFQSTRVVRWI